ncbi:MAG: hypothetical protein RIF46_01400 [Cyclobacteriaceae bacterium]
MKYHISIFIALILTSCEPLFLQDVSEVSIEVRIPQENDTIPAGTTQFWWNSLGEDIQYQLYVAKGSMDNPLDLVVDSITTQNTYLANLAHGQHFLELFAFTGVEHSDTTHYEFWVDSSLTNQYEKTMGVEFLDEQSPLK